MAVGVFSWTVVTVRLYGTYLMRLDKNKQEMRRSVEMNQRVMFERYRCSLQQTGLV